MVSMQRILKAGGWAMAWCLAASSAQAGLSQALITAPGGLAQAGAYFQSPGSSLTPGGDLLSFFPAGATVQEQAFSGNGGATASASFAGQNTSNAASVHSQMGLIHLSGNNTAPNNSSFACAAANGGWNESFTISDPAYNGQDGFMLADLDVQGALDAAGFAGRSGVSVTGYKNYSQLTIYGGAGTYFNHGASDPISTDRQSAYWGAATYAGGTTEFRTINDAITLAVPFTFGQVFIFGVYAYGSAGMRSSSGVPGLSSSMFDFAHTLAWGGIGSVIHNDAPITGYSLTSGSGLDWANPISDPVPEPTTLALMLLGGVALICWRRWA